MNESDRTASIYKEALIKNNSDDKFLSFIMSLNSDELKAYLYIEANRIQCFLSELGVFEINEKNNLTGQDYEEHIKNHILKTRESFNFLIQFCQDCCSLPKPDENLINSLIDLHNCHIRKLTDSEIKFFKEC